MSASAWIGTNDCTALPSFEGMPGKTSAATPGMEIRAAISLEIEASWVSFRVLLLEKTTTAGISSELRNSPCNFCT